MRWHRWLKALSGAGLLACGATPAEVPRKPEPPRSVVLVLENHLPAPYRLDALQLALDGQGLSRRRAPLPGRHVLARLPPLPLGSHTANLNLTVRYPSGSLGEPCVLELRASHSFELRDAPAELVFDVHAGDVTVPFDARVRLAVRTRGVGYSDWIESHSLLAERTTSPGCAGRELRGLEAQRAPGGG